MNFLIANQYQSNMCSIINRLLSIAIAIVIIKPAIWAQSTNMITPNHGLFIELGGNVATRLYNNSDKTYYFGVIIPGLGFKINNKFTAGFRLAIDVGAERYGMKPKSIFYGQFNFVNFGRLNVFIEPRFCVTKHNVSAIIYNNEYSYCGNVDHNYNRWFIEAGVGFGANFALTNRLSAQLRYMNIGYSHEPAIDTNRFNDNPGCIGHSRWCADFGLRRLELSLRYILPTNR